MELTDDLRAWGAAHAQARAAESRALQAGRTNDASDLQREAKSLREQADRLHRDIYRSLDRRTSDRTD
jgi:uncharacterized protein Yka (UPF0111/DUF47 family)